MTEYRVRERPFWSNGGARMSTYFTGGEVVSIPEDQQPDDWGDYYITGSAKDPEGHHYINTACLTPIDEAQPEHAEPTRVWSEHLADITRAVQIISDADKALKDAAPHGTPGYYSDLDFQFPRRVPISIGGIDTGWAIVWDDDSEAWMAEFGA